MCGRVEYLDLAKDALIEVGGKVGEIGEVIKKGDEQADARKGAILAIHEMCDALQLACDLISKELSTTIIEFNNVRAEKEEAIRGFFQRTAFKYSNDSLRQLLHEGKVCGELHALGDRFSQPFSDVTTGGVSLWETVKTFFRRSNRMSMALDGLYEGEMNYLNDLTNFLNDVRDEAENATAIDWGKVETLKEAGDALTEHMRNKRQTLQDQIHVLKSAADDCINKLH